MVTKRERLEAAIRGEIADRPPVALWRHFPVDDQSPESLTNSVADFQIRYDFDFVKVTPASSYCLKDWGVEDQWQGEVEGTRTYTKRVIETAESWKSLPLLDPQSGTLGDHLHCLRLLRERLGSDTPIIQTIFNPLSQAKNLAGEVRLFEHLHQEPEIVEQGLKIILDSSLAYIEALREIHIDGIFFAVQHASFRYFDRDGYRRFGEAFDQPILEAANNWWLNVLHLHGKAIMFDVTQSYPVHVVNWHDLETPPSLSEGARLFQGAVCGGIKRETLALGTPQEVEAEADTALADLEDGGLILSTGCVVPIIAPEGNIRVVRNAVDFA